MKIIQNFKLIFGEYKLFLSNACNTTPKNSSDDESILSPWDSFSFLFFLFTFFELIVFGIK